MFLPEMAMREEMGDSEALAAEQKKKPKPLVEEMGEKTLPEEWMTVPPERL